MASTCHTVCRLRSGRLPGTRVHTIPDPLATSIAAAYVTTSTRSSATSAPSPPPGPATAGDPAAAPSFFALFPAVIAASLPLIVNQPEAARGAAQEKPNLIGVLESDSTQPA